MMEDLIAEYERLRRLAITRPTATFRHWSSAAGATVVELRVASRGSVAHSLFLPLARKLRKSQCSIFQTTVLLTIVILSRLSLLELL